MPVAAVIIPAHNEAKVIGSCLSKMLEGSLAGEFEVIVAANGCTDNTVKVASSVTRARTIEIARASKQAALQAADEATKVWPRIYVNAHVQVDAHALRETAHAIVVGHAAVAIPRVQLDTTDSPWYLRKLFYLVLPKYAIRGVYALSQDAHARLGHNVDQIVSEAIRVPTATFIVTAPKTLRELRQSGIRLHLSVTNMFLHNKPVRPGRLAALLNRALRSNPASEA